MAEVKKKHNTFYLLFYALRLILVQDKLLLTSGFILTMITFFLPQAENFVTGKILDQLINQLSQGLTVISSSFWVLMLFFVALTFISRVILDIADVVDRVLSFRKPMYMEKILKAKYLALSPQVFESPGFIKEKSKLDWNEWRITEDTKDFITVLASAVSCVTLALLFIPYDWRIILILILSLVPYSIVSVFFGKQVWNIWDTSGTEKVQYSAYRDPHYNDDPNRRQEMSIMGYGHYLLRKSQEFLKTFNRRLEKNETKRLKYTLIARIFEYIAFGVTVFLVFNLLITNKTSVGSFFFVYGLLISLREAIKELFRKLINLQSDAGVFQTFYDMVNRESPVPLTTGTRLIDKTIPIAIEFKNVSFKYPGTENWIFKDLSLKIDSDEDLALVGKNGAGKSSLIKLLMRIYDPQEGQIFINGIDLKEVDLTSYYSNVGILSQQFLTINLTAAENIHLGNVNQEMNLDNIKKAAVDADADNFIQKYPEKYNTYLSREFENGILPSGGQWQKIAISRVFYRNPRLIVLDEPTSAIDSIAEEQIFSNIQKMSEGKTVIIVSHRFATVKKAKRIVVLDEGKIVEQGTHLELMANNGLYSQMYNKQNS